MPKQLYGKKKPAGPSLQVTEAPEIQEVAATEQLTREAQDIPVETADVVLPSRPVALAELPLDVIVPSHAQAREPESLSPESLEGLVGSMKEHGILSRIRVRQVQGNDELFELVFGERRWRAARLAGFTHYPVEIAQYTDEELEEIGLIENIQRQDLTPLEEAKKYQRLLALQDEHRQPRYSIRTLARRLGKDKGYIEMRLAVLRSPQDVQQLVREQPAVPLRSAFEISKVADQEKRESIITDIREGKLQKVEEVKTAVREATGKTKESAPLATMAAPPVVSDIRQDGAVVAEGQQQEGDSTQLLIQFEQGLQKDSAAIMDIVHRLLQQVGAMTPAQREVLNLYVDRWGKSMMDLKSHLRIARGQGE
jgi:ParB family chromosome partitioning protein